MLETSHATINIFVACARDLSRCDSTGNFAENRLIVRTNLSSRALVFWNARFSAYDGGRN